MRLMIGMKKALTAMALAPLAIFATTNEASAAVTATHGSACQTYWNLPSTGLLWFVDGIRNQGTAPRYVMCPVTRSYAYNPNGYAVWAEGTHFTNGAQTTCTMYVVDAFTGYVITAKSYTSSARRYIGYMFFTNSEMPASAYAGVLCYLPPNNSGVLHGIGMRD
jgi:hypothetical protein